MRQSRSIIFCAWAGLAAQSVLVAGVIAIVLAGGARQRADLANLHGKAQAAELANLTMVGQFLAAQSAVREYEATGDLGQLSAYRTEKIQFHASLTRLATVAGPDAAGLVATQARLAKQAFEAADQAPVATAGSAQAARLYTRASALSSQFFAQDGALRERLTRDSAVLAADGSRTLDLGQGWVGSILAFGLMMPMIAAAVGLRWVSRPLHDATTMVRRRARGDMHARAVPSGPADLRDLALSINFMADEGNRLRAAESDRARLQTGVRQAAIRIREHLRGAEILREAVTAVREHLQVDWVYAGVVREGQITLAGVDENARPADGDMVAYLPPASLDWLRDIYQHRSSYRVHDVARAEAAREIPAEIRQGLLNMGGASLLLSPFGAGRELLGSLGVVRYDLEHPWTDAETDAIESLAHDIGRGLEHARLYEGEERLVAELKSLDAAKTSFLASASHDLRSPLTSIIGYVEILADGDEGPLQPRQATMLDAVDRNARRLMTLIENMLTTAKIEMGGFTTRRIPVDLAGLVSAAAKVIRPSAITGGLDLEVSRPSGELVVDGDAEQLDRVLVNLLSNAVKYTPKGGHVRMALAREGDCAVLTVADTGIGIPAQDQASLFTRFFRASNAVSGAVPGSGLGMSIARTIVANHEGDISVESAESKGTTVTVRIALAGAGAPPAQTGHAGSSHRA